jgi:hypothetical protein
VSFRKVFYVVFTGEYCQASKTYCLQRHVCKISLSSSSFITSQALLYHFRRRLTVSSKVFQVIFIYFVHNSVITVKFLVFWKNVYKFYKFNFSCVGYANSPSHRIVFNKLQILPHFERCASCTP